MTASSDSLGLAIGATLAGRFRVTGILGAGAMGAVYEVRDEKDQVFAAKTLLHLSELTRNTETAARFVREGGGAVELSDPHVVRFFESGIDPVLGIPYFIMERMTGIDLDSLVSKVGPLHPAVVARIAIQACKGLSHAHSRGIVHRDVKPSNLFLHREGDGPVRVKVCDFGVAKWSLLGQDLTQSGSMLGTPLYMSPEQATNSKRVDARSDVWGLAMTVYHAIAGSAAYDRVGSIADLLMAIVQGRVPHLQDSAPWVHEGIARIVHGGLIAEPASRCPSVEAFSEALLPYAGGSDELTQEMLGPLPDTVRAHAAARTRLPTSWALSSEPPCDDTLSALSGEQDPMIGRTLAERYRVVRLVGKGGMGAVYEARDPDGTAVAVKVILESSDKRSDLVRRFVREARSLTALSSPHVVRVIDADTDASSEHPFIVMELLRGTDLESLVKKWGPLEPAPVLRIFLHAARGLAEAHRAGIIHRDVKPANIFLHELVDGSVVPKLCDFGIARRTPTPEENTVELTRTGGVIGSPLYMSPEQARSAKHVDARTDVWSLGMSMWETLSGRRPWEDCFSVGELIVAICTRPVTPLQQVAPWVEPEVAELVHRCLRADPAHRVASMEALIEALEPLAARVPRLSRAVLLPVSAERRGAVARVVPAVEQASLAGALSRTSMRSRYLGAGAILTALVLVGVAVKLGSSPSETLVEPTADPAVSSSAGSALAPSAALSSPASSSSEEPRLAAPSPDAGPVAAPPVKSVPRVVATASAAPTVTTAVATAPTAVAPTQTATATTPRPPPTSTSGVKPVDDFKP